VAATRLPIVLGSPGDEISDIDYLGSQRVRIAVQGHAPIAAAVQAIHETLQAIYEGTPPKQLKNIASSDLMGNVSRSKSFSRRAADFLGLK